RVLHVTGVQTCALPISGSSLLAPLVLGRQKAFSLLALGEGFSAEQAVAAGLIHAVVEEGELEATVLAAADAVAQKPPEALRVTRSEERRVGRGCECRAM